MSLSLEKLKNKKRIIISMFVFWLVFLAILFVHVATGTARLRTDFSISKYVGLSFPSAIAFLITNIFVSVAIWYHVHGTVKNNTVRMLLKIIIAMLIGLSLFPIGLFDNIIPEPVLFGRTPISLLHVLTSRTMFIVMAALAVYIFFAERKTEFTMRSKVAIIFAIYAMICLALFIFFPQVFWGLNILIESLYIAIFFAFVYVL